MGKKLREMRIESGLTQKQLGERVSPPIAESTIRRYELGLLKPKIETRERIIMALTENANAPTIGERIKLMRIQKGLKIKDVAERMGVSYQSYSQYENGSRHPKLENLRKIADAIGCSINDLICEKEETLDSEKENPKEEKSEDAAGSFRGIKAIERIMKEAQDLTFSTDALIFANKEPSPEDCLPVILALLLEIRKHETQLMMMILNSTRVTADEICELRRILNANPRELINKPK